MPKMKSNRGAAKRFRFSKTGKVKHKKANARHKFSYKSATRRRRLRAPGILNPTDGQAIHRLLPYGR
ncbi:MAG: 50S ribosomal protein L35 [Candidatus Binataceae bacterium]